MPQPTYQKLLGILSEKDRQIAQLQARVARLEAHIAQLEQLLEKATRAQKRQAAPFSKGTPKQDPKTPGRKPAEHYGPKAHRPLPEQPPDEIIDVPLPVQCPDCGGSVDEDHVDQQFQVEIPRQPQSTIYLFRSMAMLRLGPLF